MGVASQLTVIGAATSAGAYGPGQEKAPEVFRRYGLIEALSRSRRTVRDLGDVVSIRHSLDQAHPEAANVGLVRSAIEQVAAAVADSFAVDADVLVLGGDCTVELGTVLGARSDGSSVGLVYVDLDGDLHTPATGDGVLDWMGLAHLLGVPGTVPELAAVGGDVPPLLPPDAVFLAGVANVTAPEQDLIDRLELDVATLEDVQHGLDTVLSRIRHWAAGFDRVLVHVDIDVLHHPTFPIAHEIRDAAGLTIDELDELTRQLRGLPTWAGLTLCEVNPDRATDEEQQFHRLIALLQRAV